MGFNNSGAVALAARVASARPHLPAGFVVGVNIGRGRDTPDDRAEDDYLAAHRAVAGVADYVAVNVSSPNTPGLRDLQDPARLLALVGALAAQDAAAPLVVKLAPDLADTAFDELVVALADSPARGLILANTTVTRPMLRAPAGRGRRPVRSPLLPRTRELVHRARSLAGDRLAIIASGGIGRDDTVGEADLVEIWTALVYLDRASLVSWWEGLLITPDVLFDRLAIAGFATGILVALLAGRFRGESSANIALTGFGSGLSLAAPGLGDPLRGTGRSSPRSPLGSARRSGRLATSVASARRARFGEPGLAC